MASSPRPAAYFNFSNTPEFLDGRLTFRRASTGSYVNRIGYVATAPINTPRWTFDPLTGDCLGIIIEPQRTNEAKYSEDFSNSAWTKLNASVTANSVAAPDGATTGDTVTASTTSGVIFQAITLSSVGHGVSFSVFAKPASSDYLFMRISGSIDSVSCWFDLTNGSTGSNTAGGSTCSFVRKNIERFQNGWSRCAILVSTTTSTTFNAVLGACASDNSSPLAGNSVYLWGAQAEQQNAIETAITSYIPTPSSTAVTRSADLLHFTIEPATDKWFNTREGSIVFEWVCRDTPNTTNVVYGGLGTASDTIYIARQTSALLFGRYLTSTTSPTVLRAYTYPIDSVTKTALTWGSTEVGFTINAGTPTYTSASVSTQVSTVSVGIGVNPTLVSTGTTIGFANANIKGFSYYAKKLTSAEMMLITS